MTTEVRRPLTLVHGCNVDRETIRAQLRVNIERDLPWLDCVPAHGGELAIVAGGPSLAHYWPQIHGQDAVLSTNGTYGFLLDRGIVPDYWMLLDARLENIDFLRNVSLTTQHYLAAQCHPAIYDRLIQQDATVLLYLTTLPDTLEMTAHIKRTKVQLAGVVGTVGTKALAMGFALGYRKFHLYGYDSSYAESHHAYPQPLNDASQTIEVFLGDKRYVTTPSFAHQATEFPGFASEMAQFHGCEITLHCDGLLPDLVAQGNEEGKTPLKIREQAKYQEMWSHDGYRDFAPGERYADQAIAALGMVPGDSVIDFGCGTGRGAAALKSAGMVVTAVDFAGNCLDIEALHLDFRQECLWELPDTLIADYGYCTDVMEHIPLEKVDAVLAGIARCCRYGAFFNISTTDDNCGRLVGRKLHMSILTAGAWATALRRHFPQCTITAGETQVVIAATHLRSMAA